MEWSGCTYIRVIVLGRGASFVLGLVFRLLSKGKASSVLFCCFNASWPDLMIFKLVWLPSFELNEAMNWGSKPPRLPSVSTPSVLVSIASLARRGELSYALTRNWRVRAYFTLGWPLGRGDSWVKRLLEIWISGKIMSLYLLISALGSIEVDYRLGNACLFSMRPFLLYLRDIRLLYYF